MIITASAVVGGGELAGVVAGETANPKESVPRAANSIWFRLGFFYVIGSFMVTLVVPSNNPNLLGGEGSAASPFVIAMEEGGLPGLANLFNAIIFISVLSAGNSALYAGSRTLVGASKIGLAPKFFSRIDSKGRPWSAVLFTAVIGGGLGYLNVSNSGATVWNWFSSLVGLSTMWVWWSIFLAHIRFRQGFKAQGGNIKDLPFKAWIYPYGMSPGYVTVNHRNIFGPHFVYTCFHNWILPRDLAT